MRILVSHPGRYGDLLWALPTLRALAHSYEEQVDLLLSPAYSSESFRRLLSCQPYIGEVLVAEDWAIQESAPITPREPPSWPTRYDRAIHLAYEGWPSLPLPYEIYGLAEKQTPVLKWPFDLDVPWIAPPYPLPATQIALGFSDEHYELKTGLFWLLRQHFIPDVMEDSSHVLVNLSGGARWQGHSLDADWETAAAWIATCGVFVGCCSALHVLACALGKPVILVEPASARHNDVFYPYGKTGRVELLLGTDGQPTFDSRHLIDAIEARLKVAT